jgi:hypothetical protein
MAEDGQNNLSSLFSLVSPCLGLCQTIAGGEAKLEGIESEEEAKKWQAAGKAGTDAVAYEEKKVTEELKEAADAQDAQIKGEQGMVDLFEAGLSTLRSWYDAKCDKSEEEITIGEYPAGDPSIEHHG